MSMWDKVKKLNESLSSGKSNTSDETNVTMRQSIDAISYAEKIKTALESFQAGADALRDGPANYYINNVSSIIEEFFKRCCPFKVGGVVEITKEINFEKFFGWKPYNDLLAVGCRATVIGELSFRNGVFTCLVEIPNTDKSLEPIRFCFDEIMCRNVDNNGCYESLNHYKNKVAQIVGGAYKEWDDKFFKEEILRSVSTLKIQKGIMNFSELTKQEMLSLGFKDWRDGYKLIPIWLFRILPDDLELVCPLNNLEERKVANANDDVRFGCVAFSLKCNPKGK